MGCDIHAAIEYRESGSWRALMFPDGDEDRPEGAFTAKLDIGRYYDLFAMLAGVRNESGFEPMSCCRGVPEDISEEANDVLSYEHSATWVTVSEVLAYDWTRTARKQGFVNASQFEEWDRMKEWISHPPGWCGGVSGGGVEHVTPQEMKHRLDQFSGKRESFGEHYKQTYTHVEWGVTCAEAAGSLWTKVLPHMLRLATAHGMENVRLVMDFDS